MLEERNIAGNAFDIVLFRVGEAKQVPRLGFECS
jgi:hypothetical protein